MSWMQKHRRFMMFFILIFVGFPLALMVPNSGGGGGGVTIDTPVATVGDVKITSSEFLNEYSRYQDFQKQQGVTSDAMVMLTDGTVDEIIEGLIQRALIAKGAAENPVLPEQAYLSARLQEDTSFQNAEGEFVPALYNQWVEGQTRVGMNWDAFYESYATGVSQTLYSRLILTSPRVPEEEMHEAFIRSRRKMVVKYIAVAPEVTELGDVEFEAHYDVNKLNYMTEEERKVEYVAFSITPAIPEAAGIAVERARAGEDFKDLVEQYSVGTDKDSGGDLGWIPVTEEPTEQQEVIFALKEGDVSEPVRANNEVHVYKVVEERINEEDDSMEVHANRIVFRPSLTPEERTTIEDKATAFLAKVTVADGDVAGVASAEGLTVATSGMFAATSTEIESIGASDVFGFRQGFNTLELNTVGTDVARGNENLFVGKVTMITEPAQESFEDAREDVEQDAKNKYKVGEEYTTKVNDIVAKIFDEAKTLDEAVVLYPELDLEIKTTKAFNRTEYLFSDGLFWNTQEAFAMMDYAAVGELKGPMADFQRINHFLELVEMIEPDSAEVEPEWELSKENVIANRLQQLQTARQADYLQFMSEKAKTAGDVMRDDDVILALLGIGQENDSDSSVEETSETFEEESTEEVEVSEEQTPMKESAE